MFARGPVPSSSDPGLSTVGYVPTTNTVYSETALDHRSKAHEIGHAFDHQVLTDGDRHYFTRLLGLSGPWSQGTGVGTGDRSPNEWFADYYAAIATHFDPSREGWDSYAKLGPKRLKMFAAALDRLARRRDLPAYR